MPEPLLLRRFDDLADEGRSARRIHSDVASRTLVKVRPGVYVDGAEWGAAMPEQKSVTAAKALDTTSRRRPIVAFESAAAAHGLGLYRPQFDRVHIITPEGRPGAAVGTVRHRGEVTDDEVVELNGILCTSLERTVADVARTVNVEKSVTIADAALRKVAVPRNGVYLEDAATEFLEAVRAIVARSRRGLARAERVLAFADGRAQLPGESVSRIRLRQLGFRRIALQVAVPGPNGAPFYVDFGLEDVSAFGEFDGSIKYVKGRLIDARSSSSEIFDREKQREDWIRGRTQRRMVRWGWEHIATADALGRRLADFAVIPPA